jgi:chromosome segregation ATPase
MATKQDEIIFACDRAIAGAQELKANAVKLAQLEQQTQVAESNLRGLNAQIEQARKKAAELEQLEQKIRERQTVLAEVDAQIARKQEIHGKVDSDLRDLRKRISGDLSHP